MRAPFFTQASLFLVLALPGFIYAADSHQQEIALGYYEDRKQVAQHFLILDERLTQKVAAIGNRVVKASKQPDLRYTFRIVNDPQVNAYATAGGFIYINSGLLDELKSEDELAAILAHEVTHVCENHLIGHMHNAANAKQIGQVAGFALSVTVAVAGAYVGVNASGMGQQIGDVVGTAMANASIKGFGKNNELAADREAVHTLAKANYDPYALVRVFQHMQTVREKIGGAKPAYQTALLHADPGLDERIKSVQKEMKASKMKNEKK